MQGKERPQYTAGTRRVSIRAPLTGIMPGAIVALERGATLMFGNLFKKRVTIFKKRDRDTWKQIRAALKEEGIKGVQAGHYLQETVMGGGCGAKLDPRDFGRKGKIDREIYWVGVLPEDEEHVRDVLRRHGIVPVVEENVLLDAALRKKPDDDVVRR